MNVADEFQKVRSFLANDGFVAVLKKVATSFMALVEGNGIACHKTPHDFAERDRAGSQEEVKMVWTERPCIALSLGLFENDGKSFEEGLAVLVVLENFPSFNSPGHDVLE